MSTLTISNTWGCVFVWLFYRFGRRPVFIVCLILMIASTIAVSFSPNILVFSALRFIVSFCIYGAYSSGFVIGKCAWYL